MSRLVGISLFLALAICVVGSTHYYIWTRLVRDLALPPPWHQLGTGVVVALGLSIPLVMVVARLLGGSLSRGFIWFAFSWMGFFFLLLCVLVGFDLMRLLAVGFAKLAATGAPPDAARRLFFARVFGGGAAAVALTAGVSALRTASEGPQVMRVTVRLRRLPAAQSGFTIAQISDLHVAPLLSRDYVARLVEQTNALSPSLIVITGDLVDGTVEQLRDAVAPLAQLKAPHGVYFITGNHEYYSGVEPWLAEVRRLGMRPLRNERVVIGDGAASFDLAGIDDWTAAGFGLGHGANLKQALAGRDASRELVLLAHQPRAIFEAAEMDVGLMLSGHTHGGQIWPFGYLVKLVQPYLAGLAQHGATQIYVNRGTGYWGPPMRLGSPPELTLLELQRAA